MKFQVNWQLEHDGNLYQKGETLELDEKKDKATVDQLLTLGVITAPGKGDKSSDGQ